MGSKWMVVGTLVAIAVGCGGGGKKAADAPGEEIADESEPERGAPELIADEKLDSIKRTLDRRSRSIGRCYSDAMAANDLAKGARGDISLSFTIQPNGKASNVRVTNATIDSKTLKACVIEDVGRLTFTSLPRPLDYSYTFGFDAL